MPNSITYLQTEWLRLVLACILLLSVQSLAQGPQSRSGNGAASLGWQQMGSNADTYLRSQHSDPNIQNQMPPYLIKQQIKPFP